MAVVDRQLRNMDDEELYSPSQDSDSEQDARMLVIVIVHSLHLAPSRAYLALLLRGLSRWSVRRWRGFSFVAAFAEGVT